MTPIPQFLKYENFSLNVWNIVVLNDPIDMNVGVFWETSVGFLKSVVLQLFPKYSQSYANLDVKMDQNWTTLKKRLVVLLFFM